MKLEKIISGGESGVERAALNVARQQNISFGGYFVNGKSKNANKVPGKFCRYHMVELQKGGFKVRMEKNVRESDGTVIFTYDNPKSRTKFTEEVAKKTGKPCLIFNLNEIFIYRRQYVFDSWLKKNNIKSLNITGPRYSETYLINVIGKLIGSLLEN